MFRIIKRTRRQIRTEKRSCVESPGAEPETRYRLMNIENNGLWKRFVENGRFGRAVWKSTGRKRLVWANDTHAGPANTRDPARASAAERRLIVRSSRGEFIPLARNSTRKTCVVVPHARHQS